MMSKFKLFNLDENCTKKELKNAYVNQLKLIDMEVDIEKFQTLKKAYDECLKYLKKSNKSKAEKSVLENDKNNIIKIKTKEDAPTPISKLLNVGVKVGNKENDKTLDSFRQSLDKSKRTHPYTQFSSDSLHDKFFSMYSNGSGYSNISIELINDFIEFSMNNKNATVKEWVEIFESLEGDVLKFLPELGLGILLGIPFINHQAVEKIIDTFHINCSELLGWKYMFQSIPLQEEYFKDMKSDEIHEFTRTYREIKYRMLSINYSGLGWRFLKLKKVHQDIKDFRKVLLHLSYNRIDFDDIESKYYDDFGIDDFFKKVWQKYTAVKGDPSLLQKYQFTYGKSDLDQILEIMTYRNVSVEEKTVEKLLHKYPDHVFLKSLIHPISYEDNVKGQYSLSLPRLDKPEIINPKTLNLYHYYEHKTQYSIIGDVKKFIDNYRVEDIMHLLNNYFKINTNRNVSDQLKKYMCSGSGLYSDINIYCNHLVEHPYEYLNYNSDSELEKYMIVYSPLCNLENYNNYINSNCITAVLLALELKLINESEAVNLLSMNPKVNENITIDKLIGCSAYRHLDFIRYKDIRYLIKND